jgi:hypothetical protein
MLTQSMAAYKELARLRKNKTDLFCPLETQLAASCEHLHIEIGGVTYCA